MTSPKNAIIPEARILPVDLPVEPDTSAIPEACLPLADALVASLASRRNTARMDGFFRCLEAWAEGQPAPTPTPYTYPTDEELDRRG